MSEILLHDGGSLFVGRMNSLWTVDVFAFNSRLTDDPVYHACYNSEADALADAALWKKWEES